MASILLRLGEGAGGGGNLPGSGDADDLDVGLGGAAAEQAVEGALEQAIGDDGVPAGGDDGEGHAGGAEVAFDGGGAVVEGVLGLPEAQGQVVGAAGGELDGEEAAVPVGEFRGGEERCDLFGAVAGEQPFVDGGVDLVEAGDFDQDWRDGWGAAGDEFQVADGREEGCAAADCVLPAFAGLEAEAVEEAAELVEGIGAMRLPGRA